MVTFIGEEFSARDEHGQLKVRIATVFPAARTIVTLPGIHATQRGAYIDAENEQRAKQNKPPLSDSEEEAAMMQSVDLFADEQGVVIRPAPSRMDLALAADDLLQELFPKRRIKYLFLTDANVRDALKKRGECWRMYLPPTRTAQIRQLITDSRAGIEGRAIYYYSHGSGTRYLTCETFRKLGDLDDTELRKHLREIATYCDHFNRNGFREVDFFLSPQGLSCSDVEAAANAPDAELRPRFEELCRRFLESVPVNLRVDDPDDTVWRSRMFGRLVTQRDDVLVDDRTTGLDSEFFMRVEWLPAGRIEEGELIVDPALDQPYGLQQEKQISPVVRGLILNLVQEYGDLEYINLGSVLPSDAHNPRRGGRREVYVSQIKQRRAANEVLQIIRMQKWGVRERLDQGKSLEEAMIESEEYSEYVLDRLLACRQLGMNLPQRQTARKVSERYDGSNWRYHGRTIWTPYFQRDYIAGFATDKVSVRRLSDRAYAMTFARLLGQTAGTNMIVGRAELTGEVVFDVGDEILLEDSMGVPHQIIVADHVGTFVDWRGSLESRAAEYAGPVVRRLGMVPDRGEFAEAYMGGFMERFVRIQEDCNRNQRAFDTLFKHRPWDDAGSLACRWISSLSRLRKSNARELCGLIRQNIAL